MPRQPNPKMQNGGAGQAYAHYAAAPAVATAPAPIAPEQTSPASSHYSLTHLQHQHAPQSQASLYAHHQPPQASPIQQNGHANVLPSPVTSPDIPSQSLTKRPSHYDSMQVEKKPKLETASGKSEQPNPPPSADSISHVSAPPATPTTASPTTAIGARLQ